MKKSIYLSIYLCINLSISLNGQVINSQVTDEKTVIKRNAFYNMEEIKVRWKKAALENCPAVPCLSLSAPGPCTSIVATPTGPSSVSVSFVPPTSDGGSPITGYIVTATSTPSAPAKRKTTAAIITVSGTSSPIVVTGLVFGVNYIFAVVATNAVGSSPVTVTPTTVTPCVLNTVSAGSSSPTLAVNTSLTPNITHSTTLATGIGTAIGLPSGVTASWLANVITIIGTPRATGSFSYEIPLTGGCGSVKAMGSITVSGTPACAAAAASTTPTLPVNTVLTPNITHATTSATGIGTATGLPTGVSAAWSGNVITISGTPTNTGTFNYTIPLTGTSCSSVNATGTITVTAACAAAAASTTPTLTVNTVLTNITHATTSATGIGTPTGLPAGVSAAWSGNVITISGTPTNTGTFNYTIPLTGTSCSSVNATGTITVSAPPFTCGSSTVIDYDNNSYNTVSIGTQCWTKENLRVRRYNDGTEIRFNNSGGSGGTTSETWSVLDYGAHTIYANDSLASPSKLATYGYLYNWYAAKGIATAGSTTYKNICPTGWHVPTFTEWDTLTTYLGGVETAGTVMKDTSTLWNVAITPSPGTNTSGFSALPGGYRKSDGSFIYINILAIYWSTTEHNSSLAWFRYLNENSGNVIRYYHSKSFGSSVRCLRD